LVEHQLPKLRVVGSSPIARFERGQDLPRCGRGSTWESGVFVKRLVRGRFLSGPEDRGDRGFPGRHEVRETLAKDVALVTRPPAVKSLT
jgi:hypothetical protein